MARKSRTAVLKRQREVKKAEKAAMKREKRLTRESATPVADRVATADDLEGYGFTEDESIESPDAPPSAISRRTRDSPPTRCGRNTPNDPIAKGRYPWLRNR